jgi:hypothetical protein
VYSAVARILRLASILICLIAVASFAIFAVDLARGASSHQQEELNGGAAAATTHPGTSGQPQPSPTHESWLQEAIDEASNELTSPFSGITAGSSSEWAVRSANLLLALVIYGFGLAYLSRFIRVRA